MQSRFLIVLVSTLVVWLVSGCSTPPERELSRTPVRYASLPNGHDPLHPNKPLSPYAGDHIHAEEGIVTHYERQRGHPLQVLQLSGGGQNGAFGAGFLKGWRERGGRPQFDIVTGVSAGALLATHAFLGSPADDVVLEEIFTHVNHGSIYKEKSWIGLLFGDNSLYDTSPMQALLDKYITEETLQRVATAYDEHRRLWVGTTNLDYEQTWIWNMTLIAKEGKLELYKQVLRASASPPVAFPPVEIAGYLFGDGGVRQNLVVVGLAGEKPPPPPLYGAGTVFIIQNGKEVSPPKAVPNDAFGIASGSLDVMLNNSMESLLVRSYVATRIHHYHFKMVAVPENVDIGHNALAFDPEQMKAGFDAGYALGKQSDPWETAPPFIKDLPPWALDLI